MWNRRLGILASLALLAGGWLTAVALAAEEEDINVRVQKKIAIDCDDGDSDCGHRLIFIDDDSVVKRLRLAGPNIVWSDAHRALTHLVHHDGKGGYLGIMLSELTPELRGHFGVTEDAGVMVSKVVDDTPASRAGLLVGDIITAVDGEAVRSSRSLARAIRRHEEGTIVDLEVFRDGQVQILSPAIEERTGGGQAFRIHCGDDEDCDFDIDFDFDFHHDFNFDCGGERCNVEIDCDDGDCKCLIDGEEAECRDLRQFNLRD
ncbi:MAG: PDZ domain-containing protein [Acidobacteriota bacterium]